MSSSYVETSGPVCDPEDNMYFQGSRVRLVDAPHITGRIDKIMVPWKGPGQVKFFVQPDMHMSYPQPPEYGTVYPLDNGGTYVQMRDSGMPAWKWEPDQ